MIQYIKNILDNQRHMWHLGMRKSDYGTDFQACVFILAYALACAFFVRKRSYFMPRNQFQKNVFAFITVIVTVHSYVFYSLYVIHGSMFMSLTGETSVISAINKMGGVPVFGTPVPIWSVVLIEFVLAFTLELLLGSPLSFKLACKNFDPCSTHPVLFETAIICATVGIMCPVMSFIAAFLYYNYQAGFNMLTLLAEWLKLICFNFPFAFFTQLFFIQPFVRTVFKTLFIKDIKSRENEIKETM